MTNAERILTTLDARGDDTQDPMDVDFMVRHDGITTDQIEAAFAAVVIPEMVELQDAFKRAKPKVLEIVRAASRSTQSPRKS